jgi:hypothetical protein
MNLKHMFTMISVLPLAVACSSSAVMPTPSEMNNALAEITGQDGRTCVRVNDISGFGTLSDMTLSVSNKFRSHYLMVTMHRCPDVESSTTAAFKGAFTEFCGRRDSLYTRGGGRCPVQSVYEFENRDAAFAAYDKAKEMIRASRESADEK